MSYLTLGDLGLTVAQLAPKVAPVKLWPFGALRSDEALSPGRTTAGKKESPADIRIKAIAAAQTAASVEKELDEALACSYKGKPLPPVGYPPLEAALKRIASDIRNRVAKKVESALFRERDAARDRLLLLANTPVLSGGLRGLLEGGGVGAGCEFLRGAADIEGAGYAVLDGLSDTWETVKGVAKFYGVGGASPSALQAAGLVVKAGKLVVGAAAERVTEVVKLVATIVLTEAMLLKVLTGPGFGVAPSKMEDMWSAATKSVLGGQSAHPLAAVLREMGAPAGAPNVARTALVSAMSEGANFRVMDNFIGALSGEMRFRPALATDENMQTALDLNNGVRNGVIAEAKASVLADLNQWGRELRGSAQWRNTVATTGSPPYFDEYLLPPIPVGSLYSGDEYTSSANLSKLAEGALSSGAISSTKQPDRYIEMAVAQRLREHLTDGDLGLAESARQAMKDLLVRDSKGAQIYGLVGRFTGEAGKKDMLGKLKYAFLKLRGLDRALAAASVFTPVD